MMKKIIIILLCNISSLTIAMDLDDQNSSFPQEKTLPACGFSCAFCGKEIDREDVKDSTLWPCKSGDYVHDLCHETGIGLDRKVFEMAKTGLEVFISSNDNWDLYYDNLARYIRIKVQDEIQAPTFMDFIAKNDLGELEKAFESHGHKAIFEYFKENMQKPT